VEQTTERPIAVEVDAGAVSSTLTRADDTAHRVLAQAPEPTSGASPGTETLVQVTHAPTADAPAAVPQATRTADDVVATVLPPITAQPTVEPVAVPRTPTIEPLPAPPFDTAAASATDPTALPSRPPPSDAGQMSAAPGAAEPRLARATQTEMPAEGAPEAGSRSAAAGPRSDSPVASPALANLGQGVQPSQRTLADGASATMSRSEAAPVAPAIGRTGAVAPETAPTHRRVVTPASPTPPSPVTTIFSALRPSSLPIASSKGAVPADPRPARPAAPGGTSPSSVGTTASAGASGSGAGGAWMALLLALAVGAWGLYELLLASSGWRSSSFVSLLERPG
jgi:hypothetical protein